jgi:histidinol-phosphate aminotransferase
MSNLLNKNIDKMQAYVPGEQPQDKAYIKLNTNESPFPPSSGVINGVTDTNLQSLRLYCDPQCKVLKNKLANLYGVKEQNVFVSNGSDEILNFAFMAYGYLGCYFADVTYGFYSVFAELYNLPTTIIPLKEDFTLDVSSFYGRNGLIVIANPNAPTGLEISLDQIESIITSNPKGVVVIDEAYVDFGGTSALPLINKYDNLLVVRTYSKSRSMAGARLGYAFANQKLIQDLEKIKYSTNPYNVNSLTQLLGSLAIDDQKYYEDNCQKIIENRKYTKNELEKLGLKVLDSKANFLFAKSEKISGENLYLSLKDKGVLIRHFNKQRIADYIRITIGDQKQMQTFIEKVKEILGE